MHEAYVRKPRLRDLIITVLRNDPHCVIVTTRFRLVFSPIPRFPGRWDFVGTVIARRFSLLYTINDIKLPLNRFRL